MRILHTSDLHFGMPGVAERVTALERFITDEPLDAIVVSGDLSQRTRRREFERAARFVQLCESVAPTIVVPGNHDCAWWMNVCGLGSRRAMFSRYRRLIRDELEPVLRIPGATIVGVNSSQGIQPYTLTTRPRDLSVVGAVRAAQWERARAAFAAAPVSDLRLLVLHHNVLRGSISHRWGLATRARGMAQAAATGAEIICSGHDHGQDAVEATVEGKRFVVSAAGTLTDRVRGGLPSAWNLVEVNGEKIVIEIREWQREAASYRVARRAEFARPRV